MATPISIRQYVCNLISMRCIIGNIYRYVDDARFVRSIGGNKTYQISIPRIGKGSFDACDLVRLDRKAFCHSLEQIVAGILTPTPNLEQYIVLLLKGKSAILCLYQAEYNALDKIDCGGVYCYTFTNPFGIYANVSSNKLQLAGHQIVELFNQCVGETFDATLVFSF